MEATNVKTEQAEPPEPAWPAAVTDPLAPSLYQVWAGPKCSMICRGANGANSSGSKPWLLPSDSKTAAAPLSSTAPSYPFLHNMNPTGINGDLAAAPGDVFIKPEPGDAVTSQGLKTGYPRTTDPKKLDRIISNRLSAQRSREKKHQYASQLESKLNALQTQIALVSPQIAVHRKRQQFLQMEQKRLNQELVTCQNESMLKDAQIEENRVEVNRLKQLFLAQHKQKLMQGETRMNSWKNSLLNSNSNYQKALGLTLSMNSNQGQIGENPVEMNQLNMKQHPLMNTEHVPGWEPGLRQKLEYSVWARAYD